MKISVALCFLVVVLSSQCINGQSQNYSLTDLDSALASAKQDFDRLAPTDPNGAFIALYPHLAKALTIATQLHDRGNITVKEATDKIMNELTEAIRPVLNVAGIKSIIKAICHNLGMTFPPLITSEEEFTKFTKKMNRTVIHMCNKLGVETPAENATQSFIKHLKAAKDRFVAVAATGFERGVREFYQDLGDSLDFGVTLHQKGIYSTIEKVTEEIWRFQITPAINESLSSLTIFQSIDHELIDWAKDICRMGDLLIPCHIAIMEHKKFIKRLNSDLETMMCDPLNLPFGEE